MLIPKTTPEDHLQGIILLDSNDVVHVHPERTLPILTEVASNLYIYVANAETCEVNGYTFSSDVTVSETLRNSGFDKISSNDYFITEHGIGSCMEYEMCGKNNQNF